MNIYLFKHTSNNCRVSPLCLSMHWKSSFSSHRRSLILFCFLQSADYNHDCNDFFSFSPSLFRRCCWFEGKFLEDVEGHSWASNARAHIFIKMPRIQTIETSRSPSPINPNTSNHFSTCSSGFSPIQWLSIKSAGGKVIFRSLLFPRRDNFCSRKQQSTVCVRVVFLIELEEDQEKKNAIDRLLLR